MPTNLQNRDRHGRATRSTYHVQLLWSSYGRDGPRVGAPASLALMVAMLAAVAVVLLPSVQPGTNAGWFNGVSKVMPTV